MSDLFIPSSFIPDEYNAVIHENLRRKEETLSLEDKTEMHGYVYCIHETRDGKKELLDHNHNHIVLNGRRWLMQRAVGSSMLETPDQHTYTLNWFGLGEGGANSSDPLNPLYTPDNTEELTAPIPIKGSVETEGFTYDLSGYHKTFQKDEDGRNAQMTFSAVNSEALALFHLVVDYNDCPYTTPNLGVKISEMALYASPTEERTETNFVMFSRYCMPIKYKSYSDKNIFLWFIYF